LPLVALSDACSRFEGVFLFVTYLTIILQKIK
jgi:hypothetical protein